LPIRGFTHTLANLLDHIANDRAEQALWRERAQERAQVKAQRGAHEEIKKGVVNDLMRPRQGIPIKEEKQNAGQG